MPLRLGRWIRVTIWSNEACYSQAKLNRIVGGCPQLLGDAIDALFPILGDLHIHKLVVFAVDPGGEKVHVVYSPPTTVPATKNTIWMARMEPGSPVVGSYAT